MRVYLKIKAVQAKIWAEKAEREIKRLAVATVIMQFLLVTGYAIGEDKGYFDIFRQAGKVIEVSQAKAPKIETKEDKLEELMDYIWMKESSRGKQNFSKCEAKGKVNGIGYNIPGNGSYICFNSHEEEMQVLKGWLIAKQAAGMSKKEMLCLYSGSNYAECKE